jgi:fructose-bisphosphate aldolase class I
MPRPVGTNVPRAAADRDERWRQDVAARRDVAALHRRGRIVNQDMLDRIKTGQGFIAALDQSGGSTPKALRLYGIEESAYSDDAGMFDLIHQMRTRIITSPVFNGERILAAILFEQTMDRQIAGMGSAEYLWTQKRIVPFLKVDKGLEAEADGARMMKPIPDLATLLERAKSHGVFGTKMRSVLLTADQTGVDAVVAQQFDLARQILAAGLVPIIEPEIDIHSPEKAATEKLLKDALLARLDTLAEGQNVMLKLTLPEQDGYHGELLQHPRVLRVAALSGGYTRSEADTRLTRNPGVIASFSRALTEGLTAQMSDQEFNAALDTSIASIYAASST